MRKISYILISGCITLSIIGCDETFDTSNTSEGILSLSENGLTILQSYNVGEKYWQKALSYTTRQRFMRCAAMTMFNTFSHSKQALQERS